MRSGCGTLIGFHMHACSCVRFCTVLIRGGGCCLEQELFMRRKLLGVAYYVTFSSNCGASVNTACTVSRTILTSTLEERFALNMSCIRTFLYNNQTLKGRVVVF